MLAKWVPFSREDSGRWALGLLTNIKKAHAEGPFGKINRPSLEKAWKADTFLQSQSGLRSFDIFFINFLGEGADRRERLSPFLLQLNKGGLFCSTMDQNKFL